MKFLPLNGVSETLWMPHVKPDVVLGTCFPPECSDWHIIGTQQDGQTRTPPGSHWPEGGSTGAGPISWPVVRKSHRLGEGAEPDEEVLSPIRRWFTVEGPPSVNERELVHRGRCRDGGRWRVHGRMTRAVKSTRPRIGGREPRRYQTFWVWPKMCVRRIKRSLFDSLTFFHDHSK